MTDKFGSQINELWANFGSDFTYPGNLPSYVEDYFEEQNGRVTLPARTLPSHVQCLPQPGNVNATSFFKYSTNLKYFMICRSFFTVPRSLRLVDSALRRVGGIFARHARKRDRGVCTDILQKQDGCSPVPGLQPRGSRFLHGHLSRSDRRKKKETVAKDTVSNVSC